MPKRTDLNFDTLLSKLKGDFSQVPEHRRSNASIALKDILLGTFAMFSLKCASLLEFDKRTRVEDKNLQSIYQIDKLCSDTQMRTVLDKVNPAFVRATLVDTFNFFQRSGGLRDYLYINGKRLVSIDGVEHFSSQKIHCQQCLERTHRDGSVTYSHAMLCAVMVHPDKAEVFPLDAEPIVRQDGEQKNDCELNAVKRLIDNMLALYPKEKFVVNEDALFANEPHIRKLKKVGWSYIIAVKPDSHKTLFKQIEGRLKIALARQCTIKEAGYRYHFTYCNQLALSEKANDVRVNFFSVKITDPKGDCTTFSWITDFCLRRNTLMKLMRAGRARWKIENETFNTLKNQGYHFEHNYGHGEQYLATVLAFIMLLAFLVDQIQQSVCKIFKKLWENLRTKAKLWESIRAVFKVKICQSMYQLYYTIAELYEIQLE